MNEIGPTFTRRLFSHLKGTPFTLTLWDGTKTVYGSGRPHFQLTIKTPQAISAILRSTDLGFAESYMNGDIDVEGSLNALVAAAMENEERLSGRYRSSRPGKIARFLINRSTSIAKQRKEIAHHYDLGNDFYKLWLDKQMVYSCAYFKAPADTIDTAQAQKLDHTLAKLRLKKGEHLLDVGSGWGAMVIHAAKKYGVNATGITLSKEQLKWTRDRVKREGLGRQVTVEYMDYRELPRAWHNRFDKWVSVGMYEHVGKANGPVFMNQIAKTLKPQGIGLLHSIFIRSRSTSHGFMNKYIFPGSYLDQLPSVLELLHDRGFYILDVEDLRPHYALTLDRWAEAFEKNVDTVRSMYGEPFVRMWRLYLRGSAESFRHGKIYVAQILFSKGPSSELPLTRVV